MVLLLRLLKNTNQKLNLKKIQEPPSSIKLLIFEKDSGWVKQENKKLWATSGDIFFIGRSNRICDFSEIEGVGWLLIFNLEDLIEVLITQSEKMALFSQLSHRSLLISFLFNKVDEIEKFQIPQQEQIKWMMRMIWLQEELENEKYYFSGAVRAMLKLLSIDLARLMTGQEKTNLSQSDPLLNQVFSFIESNYEQTISLVDVAKEVRKTTSYLTNFVRQKTGLTVLQWIIEFRMAKARYLLLETEWSVETIAEKVGYLDLRHFSRQFSRIHGSSPKTWQSLHLNCSMSDKGVNNQKKFLLPYNQEKYEMIPSCFNKYALKT